jgi:uncharacterized phosphosugar-binding protein
MDDLMDAPALDRYYRAILELEERVIVGQRALLGQVAAHMAAAIQRDQRIFIFGSGHSHLIAEEAFYRAGGLAAATPVFSTLVMLHENPALAGRLERTSGLASLLLEPYNPQPGEMIFIISNSGVNQLPVEMALVAKDFGLLVVSISSLQYASVAPLSGVGKRLDEVADICLDNGLPPGDGLAALEPGGWRVGPGSTVLVALLWNCLVVETAFLLQAAGQTPPVFISYNMPGAAEHNQALLEHWRKVNPHLS